MTRTETARQWLRSMRGQWRVIAEDTGLSYWTLQKFAQGRRRHPRADFIDRLLAYRDELARADAA